MPTTLNNAKGVFAAGCVGAVLYAFMLVGSIEWLEGDILLSNALITPFYVLPIVVALYRSGRMGWPAAIWLTLTVTAAHCGATWLALRVIDELPRTFFLAGAVGGAFGAATSFLAVSFLGADLRDRWHLLGYFVATAVLTAIGAVGVRWMGESWLDLALRLYIPWQVAFSAALTWAFRDHVAGGGALAESSADDR